MNAIEIDPYARRRDEIKDLKKELESLRALNTELDQKVNDIYGAYQTLQYSYSGRCKMYSEEILRLRTVIESLKKELRNRGWDGD